MIKLWEWSVWMNWMKKLLKKLTESTMEILSRVKLQNLQELVFHLKLKDRVWLQN